MSSQGTLSLQEKRSGTKLGLRRMRLASLRTGAFQGPCADIYIAPAYRLKRALSKLHIHLHLALWQHSLSCTLQVYLALAEALCIVSTALETTISAAGLYHIREVNTIMITHPHDLGFVALKHL